MEIFYQQHDNPGCFFDELINKALKLQKIDFRNLNIDYTYIFELVSPENQVVIRYPEARLYHIGTRNNRTGQEMNIDIGLPKPKEYPLSSLSECIEAASKLNKQGDTVSHEGFVVVDDQFHRVKVKSPEYLLLHHATDKSITKKDFIEMIRGESNLQKTFIDQYPEWRKVLAYYEWQYQEFLYEVNKMAQFARSLYKEYSYERKAVANAIKAHPYSAFGFMALGNDLTAEELVDNSRISQICQHISDYEGKIPHQFKKYEKNCETEIYEEEEEYARE